MIQPLLSYVTSNCVELTTKTLSAVLKTVDDFEMHIIDNNSSDNTWEYIQSLDDDRIKSKTKFDVNYGKIFATNLNLTKRRPEQSFITVDNTVSIVTKDFIARFMKVFETFPEVGLLGVREWHLFPKQMPRVVSKTKNRVSYLELKNSDQNVLENYIPSNCMCLRPELIKEIGYLCEENCYDDIELSYRVNNYTSFKAGFTKDITIKMPQSSECKSYQYTYDEFKKKFKWKFDETLKDMKSGARPVYCASCFDSDSTSNHIYNKEWSMENLTFFIDNPNYLDINKILLP